MSGRRVIAWVFVFFLVWPVVTGCSHLRMEKIETEPYVKELSLEDYPKETERLLNAAANHPEESNRIHAHLQLGKMYTTFDNPKRDYQKAMYHFNKYMATEKTSNHQREASDWLVVIKELERRSKKIKERNVRIISLKQEKDNLSHIADRLKRENHDLNDKIEKLKELEIRYEKKRRSYR